MVRLKRCTSQIFECTKETIGYIPTFNAAGTQQAYFIRRLLMKTVLVAGHQLMNFRSKIDTSICVEMFNRYIS